MGGLMLVHKPCLQSHGTFTIETLHLVDVYCPVSDWHCKRLHQPREKERGSTPLIRHIYAAAGYHLPVESFSYMVIKFLNAEVLKQ